MSRYITAIRVNAGREDIDALAIMAFRERCSARPFKEPVNPDPLHIPTWLDRRKKE